MPFGVGRKPKQVIDREQCWNLYMQLKSVHKVALALYDMGQYNQVTGKPFSDQGIWESNWRYAFDHLVEARKAANENVKANRSELLTDDVWYRLVIQKAKYILRGKEFDKFIEKHVYLKAWM